MAHIYNNDCTVLVSSFDGFADCWDNFAYGIDKYWADCPWPIVLMTGEKTPEYPRISVLPLGSDRGWASNMIAALKQIESPYVLYLQEDYWLVRAIDSALMKSYLEQMRAENWHYLRLTPWPPADQAIPGNNLLGRCLEHNPNRLCLQAALWEKKFLLSLLFEGENGWDFERMGRPRSEHLHDGILSVNDEKNGILYCAGTAVRKGRWTQGAITFARKEGLKLAPRPKELWFEEKLSAVNRPWPAKIMARLIARALEVMRKERALGNFLK